MNVQKDMDWFDIMSKDGEVMNNELFLELASKEVREYVLGHLPKDGNTSEFEVYLDESHNYTTGTFTMGQVLDVAENHNAGILGKPHFWEASEKEIERVLDDTMASFFGK